MNNGNDEAVKEEVVRGVMDAVRNLFTVIQDLLTQLPTTYDVLRELQIIRSSLMETLKDAESGEDAVRRAQTHLLTSAVVDLGFRCVIAEASERRGCDDYPLWRNAVLHRFHTSGLSVLAILEKSLREDINVKTR